MSTQENSSEVLQKGLYTALKTYSNVHRGSGHYSMITTLAYEKAREIVLEHLKLDKKNYTVVFSPAPGADFLTSQLDKEDFMTISSGELNLCIGVVAIAIQKSSVGKIKKIHPGGGTAKLISGTWALWADAPDRFEAGTPATVNIILFAMALQRKLQNIMASEENLSGFSSHDFLYRDDTEDKNGMELLDYLQKKINETRVSVPTSMGSRPFINLDNGASTPAFPQAASVFEKTFCLSSEQRKQVVEEVKSVCHRFLKASPADYDIIFTSNTTEGINFIAGNASLLYNGSSPVIVNSLLEHNSNELPWRTIPNGQRLTINVDKKGFVDLERLTTILNEYNRECKYGDKRVKLVTISGASNVLGIYNDLHKISRIVHEYDALLMVDAAQMVAHRETDIDGCGIDFLVFSAHKAYAPFGSGVLVARKGLLPQESLTLSHRHENPAGIAAMGKALILLEKIGMDILGKKEQKLTTQALEGLRRIPGIIIYGINDPADPDFESRGGVISFSHRKIFAHNLARELAVVAGIGIRSGCHCSHMLIKHLLNFKPSLEKVQYYIVKIFSGLTLPGVARISIGIENTEEDIDCLIKSVKDISGSKVRSTAKSRTEVDDFVRKAAEGIYS